MPAPGTLTSRERTVQTLRLLRGPRYFAFSLLMVFVALVCIAAGSWQVMRLEQKVHANGQLRGNAHAAPVAVTTVLPLVGAARPSTHAVEFRPVSATGTYDAAHTTLVRNRDDNGDTGWYVVTPLVTDNGTLLVARGFASDSSVAPGAVPTVPSPPSGRVTVIGRAAPADTKDDEADQLTHGQVESLNPTDQQGRTGGHYFDGYAALESGQPGVGPLSAIPGPDLSNPAGGAVEPQHLAYVIQWYLFAMLALAAPVVMARSENKHQFVPPPVAETPEQSVEQARAAKLADRYGRTFVNE